MATKYVKTAQTAEQGVAQVRKIAATHGGAIFRPFESSDIGIDGTLELLTEGREPSGDIVLVQIKAGASYIRKGKFFLDADRDHFEAWARYSIPVIGVVCDLETNEARWVDISAHLHQNLHTISVGPFSVEAPATQPFSRAGLDAFLKHFRRPNDTATSVEATPNLLIRPWESADMGPTRALLESIAIDYPGFDAWLEKKLQADSPASKKVVIVGKAVAAFSMWQQKDERNVKLQTFIVGDLFRGTSIGPHLLLP
jgi:Domain of unknown function (DUF4365)